MDRDKLVKLAKAMGVWDPLIPAPAFYDPERDGVTFSTLDGWKRCKELGRLNLHGITPRGSSLALVHGSLIHAVLQIGYEAVQRGLRVIPDKAHTLEILAAIQTVWEKENPRASADMRQHAEFSMTLAEAVMPFYFQYWKADFTDVDWTGVEREFKIPRKVTLWNGRVINTFIRGKMDGNFRKHGDLYLFETKNKSHIDESTIADILPHELQVNIYMWAMSVLYNERPAGVRYNIIRRPLLRQKKTESLREFALRCAQDVKERPDFYFIRMDMEVTPEDTVKFEGEFNDMLADFLSWHYGVTGHYKDSSNCENKYGTCPMLPICGHKSYEMFFKRPTVFRELEEM